MFTGYQILSLAIAFAMLILAVAGIIAKSQGSLKQELHVAIDKLASAHASSLGESRNQFTSINESFTKIAIQINTILEGTVRRLEDRVGRLESGQDDWTKEIRQRTHDLGNVAQRLTWEVEAIKKESKL